MARVSAVCEYVQDGDTFRTAMQNWIRLANVCAPSIETERGKQAKRTLESLILKKNIIYEQVGTSYGRLVSEVWVNTLYVNEYMRQQSYTCPQR
jgi:endonuclease YncB( thermonuclease family)